MDPRNADDGSFSEVSGFTPSGWRARHAGWLAGTVACCAGLLSGPSARADVTQRNVPVTVSDGTVLSADLFLPGDGTGTYPTLLTVTPFGRALQVHDYVANGYAHVNVMERGSGLSGGVWCALCDRDQQDGYEL